MPTTMGFSRRSFLQNTGMTALMSAVGAGSATAPLLAGPLEEANAKYDFDAVYNRKGTDSVKWDQAARNNAPNPIDVGMGIADMDFRAAPCITKALTDRVAHENWGYLDMPKNFAEGIVAWNKKRYNVDINPDLLVISTGVHPGLIAALQTFSPPGSKVLLNTPTYNGFFSDLTFTRTKAEENVMKRVNGRYHIDFDDFERRISHDTQTFILCNPQNPTGNCWTREELTKLGEICLRRRVIVLADEIHCDFVSKGQKYTPFASLDKEIVNNSITFKAASKSFGLAAMKCGWFYSTNADYIARIKQNHRADLTTTGILANRAAYAEGGDWLDQVVSYIDGNLEFTAKFIREKIPMIKMHKPEGTYLTWLDMTAVADKIGAQRLADEENKKSPNLPKPLTAENMLDRWLVKNARVALNPGNTYGKGGENHMRMNVALSRKLVELALNNMASAINKL